MIGWTIIHCIVCDCEMAITDRMKAQRKRDKKLFYCPNGHSQLFSQSEADVLRLERDRLKQEAARLQDELAAEKRRADEAEKRHISVKRRAVAALCPCCNRSFSNVARHMKTKHPNVLPLAQKI